MSKYNILISNAQLDSANKGCGALAYSTIFLIDEIMQEHNQPYALYLSSYSSSRQEKEVAISNKKIKYYEYTNPLPLNLKNFFRKCIFFKQTLRNLKIVKRAKIRLDIGEGDSFSDIYGTFRFKIINGYHELSNLLKVPYVLLPQTIGPFNSDEIKHKAIKSMKHAIKVMARDKISSDLVKALTPTTKSDEYIDLAFLLPYTKQVFDTSKYHVGINISALLWYGGYTQDNQFKLESEYKETVLCIIQELLNSRSDIQIHLIPHVYDLSEGTIENDYYVMTEIYKTINDSRVTLAPAFFNPIEAKSYISGMDFFMGARMHSTIAAFSSGVPVLPMAYSRKFNGLFVETLNYPYIIDLKKDSLSIITKKVLEYIDESDSIIKSVNTSLESIVKPRITKLKSDLSKILFPNED